ncbi:hypothetical protein Lal_00046249 [Lupinus albus]|uniref:Putative pectinesterase inhibitor domain-containing protein n=1 Tax=Lupinus albus TaxID=3870 RepID=A0A6A4PDH4_LUPAL|nr:putative pectinesterase inhibitor domain-containing protein [Lupinus albus]KAF1887011.1 hypothetical protein Lal_00046249 [Lupinus albus]
MAYFSIRPSLISSLVLVSILLATPSSASKFVDVNVLCAQTRDPSFCSIILNSKPGGVKGADLVSLAQYTNRVARARGMDATKLLNTLVSKTGSDPKAKAHYINCWRNFNSYQGAFKYIDNIEVALNKEDYYGVFHDATVVLRDIYDCISGDYLDRSHLPQSVDIFERVVDIILTISKYLIQK